jgi:hypothetical protein
MEIKENSYALKGESKHYHDQVTPSTVCPDLLAVSKAWHFF